MSEELGKGIGARALEMRSRSQNRSNIPVQDSNEFKPDPDTKPPYYAWHPAIREVADLTEHFNSNLGHAIEFLFLAHHKGQPDRDLASAQYYIERERERIKRHGVDLPPSYDYNAEGKVT